MKPEDITAIASSTIAVTLILGTVFYFQQEGEKMLLREERVEQIQLKIKKKTANEKFIKDRDNCKTFFDEDIGYTKCMKSKGWTKRLFNWKWKTKFYFLLKSIQWASY